MLALVNSKVASSLDFTWFSIVNNLSPKKNVFYQSLWEWDVCFVRRSFHNVWTYGYLASHIATLLFILHLKIDLDIQVKIAGVTTLLWEMCITKNAWIGNNPLCSCLELFWVSSGGSSPCYWGKCAVMCIKSALSNAQMMAFFREWRKYTYKHPIPKWHCSLVKRIACGAVHYAKRSSSFSG